MKVTLEITEEMDCNDCKFYNRQYLKCKLYNSPIPVNINLKPLKCEVCREELHKHESTNQIRYN